jgi:flagellar hook assembly protein FlgD
MKKCLTIFAFVAAGIASAATYHVRLLDPTVVNGAELKPGDYKVEVTENKAVFRMGKKTLEAPVKVENASGKYDKTTLRYGTSPDGKMTLQSIRVGGSSTTLVFAN